MADLGSLYFDILLRDKTAAERSKIKAGILRDLQLTLDLKVDSARMAQQARQDLQNQLQGHQFKIGIVVDKATATQAVQQALAQVRTWNGKYTADDLRAEKGRTEQAIQQLKAAQAELARVRAAHIRAADAANTHASASVSLGNILGSNIKIAGKLGEVMAGVFSINLLKEFLSNVVEIGGELEHQKIAMDTIFGDKGKTIDLFDKIKGLARNSPFGVMELTASVKALSAYGVEYNEIYDTAKRLADISAATSVDINRLILAFGKTKSRTFLDGLEAKQFAYANIPIYDMLSKKLTELEGKFVSVKDVMGRIKKREIGFDMVKEVLWDLTDEGGKFYNMQEALAGSVKTSWKLVKDNIELMYGELAESLGRPLKGTAEILQGLTRNWRTVITVLGSVISVYGLYRISALAANAAIGSETRTTYQNILALKKKEAERLRAHSLTQKLTAAELQLVKTADKLTVSDMKLAIQQRTLTSNDIIRLGTAGKLNKELLTTAVRTGEITAQQARSIITGRALWMNLGKVGNRLKMFGYLMKDFGKAIWSFVSNPWFIAMTAISGVMTLIQRNSQEMDKAKEIGDNLFTKATEGAANLSEKLKDIKPASELNTLELTQGIEKMELALKDYSPDPIYQINDALMDQSGNVRTLEERYEALRQKVTQLKESYDGIATSGLDRVIQNAINATNGSNSFTALFNDDINTDASDYHNALRERDNKINKYIDKNAAYVDKIVKKATELDSEFAAATKDMKTNAQKFTELVVHQNLYSRALADRVIRTNVSTADGGNNKSESALKELRSGMETVWKSIATAAKQKGIESLSEATDDVKESYALMIKNWIEGLTVDDEVKDTMFAYFSEMLKFDFERWDAEGAMLEAFEKEAPTMLSKELVNKLKNGIELTPEEQQEVNEAMYAVYLKMYEKTPDMQRKALNAVFAKKTNNGFTWNTESVGRLVTKMDVTLEFPDWKREINKQFGGDPTIQAWLKGSADIPSFIKAAQEGYKTGKEAFDKLKPLSLKAGLSLDFSNMQEIPETILSPTWASASEYQRQIIHEYNEAVRAIKAATKAGKSMGFDASESHDKSHKNKGGSKKDEFAQQMKERLNLLKNAYSEYKKWLEIIGKDEALAKVKNSGMFDSLFSGKEPVNLDDYKKELDNLLKKIDDKTKERRELKVSIKKLLLDIDADEVKKASEQLKKQLENEISRIDKQWDIYKQLVDAGASKADASAFAFSMTPDVDTKAEELRDNIEKRLKGKGLEVPITLTEDEATELMGGEDSVIYKQFFKAWKEAKDAIEKDTLDVKLREVKVLHSQKSTTQKINDLNEEYSKLTGLSVGKNGELEEVEGMTAGQKAFFKEYQEKLASLQSDLLTLLPIWEQIFGDHTHQSYKQVEDVAKIADEIVKNAKVQKNADGKPTIFTSSYTDKDGGVVNIKGQYSQLEKLKKSINDLYKEGLKKNPFATLVKNIREIFDSKDKKEGEGEELSETISKIGESASECAQMVGSFASQMSEMFEAAGDESGAAAMAAVGDVMNSIANIGQAFAKGDIIGGIAAAASEAIGWIIKAFQAHDNALKKQIEQSERRVKQLENLYDAVERHIARHLGSANTLQLVDYDEDVKRLKELESLISKFKARGNLNVFDLKAIAEYSQEAEKLRARINAFEKGGAYAYQRQLKKEKLAELEEQLAAQKAMKHQNKDEIDDLEAQISEARDEILQFAEDVADELYGINLKDWASQIGDALFDAWKTGEDAAKAFDNTVADIMGNVLNNILRLAVIEPAIAGLRDMLFGKDGEGGLFGENFDLDESDLEQIFEYLMGIKDKSDAISEAFDKVDAYAKEKYGISLKDLGDNASGLSKGIQAVTESTADLLASYINAIRADVSMKREYIRALVEDLLPRFNIVAEAQLRQLEQIANNTGRNALAAEEILELLNTNTNPGNGFKIA